MKTTQGQDEPLRVWCIYENPRESPGMFVVREWIVLRDREPQPAMVALMAETLEAARKLIPDGLVALARSPGDDPAIVEMWL